MRKLRGSGFGRGRRHQSGACVCFPIEAFGDVEACLSCAHDRADSDLISWYRKLEAAVSTATRLQESIAAKLMNRLDNMRTRDPMRAGDILDAYKGWRMECSELQAAQCVVSVARKFHCTLCFLSRNMDFTR
jgi:hypothetical protein